MHTTKFVFNWRDRVSAFMKNIGTEFCSKIITDGQGGAIIGLFDDDPPADELKGLYIFRLDPSGQQLWRTLIIGSGSFSCSNSESAENYDLCVDNEVCFQMAGQGQRQY